MKAPIAIIATLTLALLLPVGVVCLMPGLVLEHIGGSGIAARYDLFGSVSGDELLEFYQSFSHTVFVLLFLGAAVYLIVKLYTHTSGPYLVIDKTSIRRAGQGLRTGWPTFVLFLIYAIAMFDETSFYHGEIVGWYTGVYTQDLLNNFRLNEELISESMRRDDFRFFPLAHHDLHVLGWFTPYIKVWILISALELFLIVYLATRLIQKATTATVPFLLFAGSLLFLLNAGTARAFFQLVFAERMVVVFFAIFVYCYFRYRQTSAEKYLYGSLLAAWCGIFFKDIAVILFAGLPFVHAGVDLFWYHRAELASRTWKQRWVFVADRYPLETALAGIMIVWLALFVALSFLPSLVYGERAYNEESPYFRYRFDPGETRLLVVPLMLIVRVLLMAARRTQWELLDALNVTAILYGFAIWALVGWSSYSYVALPIYFVGLINLLYIITLAYKPIRRRVAHTGVASLACAVCIALLLTFENVVGRSFVDVIEGYKTQQHAWRMTMKQANRALRKKRDLGEPANLIYTKSWFNEHRHLDRLKYDRLIYLDPKDGDYVIKDGRHRGTLYLPQYGDLLVNIDEDDLSFLGDDLKHWQPVYIYDEELPYARIYMRTDAGD